VTSSETSLVLGVAAGLPRSAIEPFADSLRATGYAGRFGLVLAQYDDRALDELRSLADFSVVVDAGYPAPRPAWLLQRLKWLRDTPGWRKLYPSAFRAWACAGRERTVRARWERLEFSCEGLQSLRYRHYYEVLQGLAADAQEILLSDLRDVIFQADPFARPLPPLELALEDPSATLTEQPNNRRWLAGLYGERALAGLEGLVVSCSGTVIGRRAGILHYLSEMRDEIAGRRRPLGSHDQGVHNYLLRSGRFGDPAVVANGHGRILTMGAMASVPEREDGIALNADGTVPAVLHQYDRDPARAERLLRRLAPGPA
jgi:hypothetical protein